MAFINKNIPEMLEIFHVIIYATDSGEGNSVYILSLDRGRIASGIKDSVCLQLCEVLFQDFLVRLEHQQRFIQPCCYVSYDEAFPGTGRQYHKIISTVFQFVV